MHSTRCSQSVSDYRLIDSNHSSSCESERLHVAERSYPTSHMVLSSPPVDEDSLALDAKDVHYAPDVTWSLFWRCLTRSLLPFVVLSHPPVEYRRRLVFNLVISRAALDGARPGVSLPFWALSDPFYPCIPMAFKFTPEKLLQNPAGFCVEHWKCRKLVEIQTKLVD